MAAFQARWQQYLHRRQRAPPTRPAEGRPRTQPRGARVASRRQPSRDLQHRARQRPAEPSHRSRALPGARGRGRGVVPRPLGRRHASLGVRKPPGGNRRPRECSRKHAGRPDQKARPTQKIPRAAGGSKCRITTGGQGVSIGGVAGSSRSCTAGGGRSARGAGAGGIASAGSSTGSAFRPGLRRRRPGSPTSTKKPASARAGPGDGGEWSPPQVIDEELIEAQARRSPSWFESKARATAVLAGLRRSERQAVRRARPHVVRASRTVPAVRPSRPQGRSERRPGHRRATTSRGPPADDDAHADPEPDRAVRLPRRRGYRR